MKSVRSCTLFCNKIIFLGCVAAFVLVSLLLFSKPVAAQAINRVYCTDVRDGGFIVSWTTDVPSDGHVDWGTTTALGNTTSDPVINTTTHYVILSGLTPNTTHYFQVRSGGSTDDNGGSYYTCTTGPTLVIPTPGRDIFGYVYQADGITPVPNAILYFRLQDADGLGSPDNSQWVTARADNDGLWFYSLGNIRTENATGYFSFTDGVDEIRFVAQGGSAGTAGATGEPITHLIPTAYPALFNFSLIGDPTAIRLVAIQAAGSAAVWLWLPFGLLIAFSIVVWRRKRSDQPGS